MKKTALLVLVLLFGLPGCNGNRQQSMTKPVDVEAVDVEMMDTVASNDFDNDDHLRTYFDFDEDVDTFAFDDAEDDFYNNFDLDFSDDQEYAWMEDSQSEDELKALYFGFNKYGLTQDQKESIEHNISQIKSLLVDAGDQAKPKVVIKGHTDEEGAPTYNIALSGKRARYVADLLSSSGIDQELLQIVECGQEFPVVVNGKTREERAPNRRVEISVIYS